MDCEGFLLPLRQLCMYPLWDEFQNITIDCNLICAFCSCFKKASQRIIHSHEFSQIAVSHWSLKLNTQSRLNWISALMLNELKQNDLLLLSSTTIFLFACKWLWFNFIITDSSKLRKEVMWITSVLPPMPFACVMHSVRDRRWPWAASSLLLFQQRVELQKRR